MLLKEMEGCKAISQIEFNNCPFWIRGVYNLPLYRMDKENAMIIGVFGSRSQFGRNLRIRINLDLTRPLMRGLHTMEDQPLSGMKNSQFFVTFVVAYSTWRQ